MKLLTATAAILATTAFAGAANAVVVLSDDFNNDAMQLNWSGDSSFTSLAIPTVHGKTTRFSSTDLIGSNFKGLCLGGGRCVDLDGSTGNGNTPAGELQSNTTFGANYYTLSFGLNGNQRGAAPQTTTITLGGITVASITLASNAPYQVYTYLVHTTQAGYLNFIESGPSSSRGSLLDNVSLATVSVPEPASWALMVLGIGGIGGVVRSRRNSASATA